LVITGATDYNLARLDLDPDQDPLAETAAILDAIDASNYDALRARHVADHAPRMASVHPSLTASRQALPTDERLRRVVGGAVDPHLTGLYLQYGRYLLLGRSGAPGVVPANLQGTWNEHMHAPWESGYHA